MRNIAFLYLEKTYSVYHTIGIAIELSKMQDVNVTAFCNNRSVKLVNQILSAKENRVNVINVKPLWHFELPVYAEIKIQMRNLYFRKYKNKLKNFDVVVSTLYNEMSIKKIVSDNIKLIYTGHGVSNSEYSFSDKIKGYDFVLLAGEEELAERKRRNQVAENNSAVIGYPKLDVIPENTKLLFNNNNKTFLYNPHWEKGHTSYFKYGKEILSFFKDHPEYNLIFAPHSLLKERHFKLKKELKDFKDFLNILIDTGSERGNNMTYTKYADVYIGDYSSQALEFALLKRRPCIFINPNSGKYEEKALSWQMGKVYSNFTENTIELALNEAEELFDEKYKNEQNKTINRLFTMPKERTSSEEAALVVCSFAKTI